jgi:hypothetical protein
MVIKVINEKNSTTPRSQQCFAICYGPLGENVTSAFIIFNSIIWMSAIWLHYTDTTRICLYTKIAWNRSKI